MRNAKQSDRRNWRALKLANLLKREREALGLSQRELARELGISRTYYSRLERGDYGNPSALMLFRIAKRLHISMDELCLLLDDTAEAAFPGLAPYIRAWHPNWPDAAVGELEGYYRCLKDKHGL